MQLLNSMTCWMLACPKWTCGWSVSSFRISHTICTRSLENRYRILCVMPSTMTSTWLWRSIVCTSSWLPKCKLSSLTRYLANSLSPSSTSSTLAKLASETSSLFGYWHETTAPIWPFSHMVRSQMKSFWFCQVWLKCLPREVRSSCSCQSIPFSMTTSFCSTSSQTSPTNRSVRPSDTRKISACQKTRLVLWI